MSTPTTPPPAPTFTKPEGVILVKGQPDQADGKAIFAIWPTGFIRQLTAAEWTLWGSPPINYVIPPGDDAQYNQLAAYDRALRA